MSVSIIEGNVYHKILVYCKIFTKSPCLNLHIKRYKHLVRFSNYGNLQVTGMRPLLCEEKGPKSLLTPCSARHLSFSQVLFKSENDDDEFDMKNDPMIKKWMAEISKDFESKKPKIIILNVEQKERDQHGSADKVKEKDVLNDVETKSLDVSEWTDYYGMDDGELSNRNSKQSKVSPNSNVENSLDSDSYEETSDGEQFSNSDSDSREQGLCSDWDSSSESESDKSSKADNFYSFKTTEDGSPKQLFSDTLTIGPDTRMEDISGKYIKLHNVTDNVEYDRGEYISDSETSDGAKMPNSESEEVVDFADDAEYEEIDDFPDDFEEATSEMELSWVPPVELNRGKEGVFDLPDLVTMLRSENAEDIVVIKIPDIYQFGDYMVIASAKSTRHLRAVMTNTRKVYKMKKHPKDRQVDIEGLTLSQNWLAADLGNIILHVFLPKARKVYDLETLWTVGEEFDDKFKEEDEDFGIGNANRLWLESLEERWKE